MNQPAPPPPSPRPSRPVRVLGIDFGTRRVGLAVGDLEFKLASPLEIYHRRNADLDGRYFREVADREGTERLVVGVPVHMSGQESGKSREARAFGQWLHEVTGRPVVYFDERYSTAHANQLMAEAGWTEKQRRERRDMLAAQVMLQAYFDSPAAVDGDDEGTRAL